MAASRNDIARWFDVGVTDGATHMIVVCDTYDYDDYPVYVDADENPREKVEEFRTKSMQEVMEIYDLSRSKADQLSEHRAMHLPVEDGIPFTEAAVMGYLDNAIREWRKTRDKAIAADDPIEERLAIHYIDAFQSIRTSLFESVLEPDG